MQRSSASLADLRDWYRKSLTADSWLELCLRKEGQREVCPAQSRRKSAESSSQPSWKLTFLTVPIWPDPKAIGFWIWTNVPLPAHIPCRIKSWLSSLAEDLAIGSSSVQTLSPRVAVPSAPNSRGFNLDPTSSCFCCRIIWLSISMMLISNWHE